MRKMRRKIMLGMAAGAALLAVGSAQASLTVAYQFNGKGNWSIDAVGSNNTPVGNISAIVPVGSVVEKAFLYSSTYFTSPTPSVNFDGTVISGGDWDALGLTSACCQLQAFREDVTAQVIAKVGGGSAVPFTFSVLSETGNVDGEVLAIIYSNPAEKERTIAILDGNSITTGDSTTINLADALTAVQLADPNFEALMSLGIGFSTGGAQASTVDINVAGNRLTSAAGGYDDGGLFNGGLITAGGIGDSTANPVDPNNANAADDELYSLTPFLSAGETSIRIDTRNASGDDNIFFAALNLTARANVNAPAPEPVPDAGSTLALLGLGMAGLAFCRRNARS